MLNTMEKAIVAIAITIGLFFIWFTVIWVAAVMSRAV